PPVPLQPGSGAGPGLAGRRPTARRTAGRPRGRPGHSRRADVRARLPHHEAGGPVAMDGAVAASPRGPRSRAGDEGAARTARLRPSPARAYDSPMAWHLAQLNIARLVAPIDDPSIDDFREALPAINALGEGSTGFVWRLVGESESTGATDVRWPDAPDDPLVI